VALAHCGPPYNRTLIAIAAYTLEISLATDQHAFLPHAIMLVLALIVEAVNYARKVQYF
jgi:hypothetical protein